MPFQISRLYIFFFLALLDVYLWVSVPLPQRSLYSKLFIFGPVDSKDSADQFALIPRIPFVLISLRKFFFLYYNFV